MSRLCSFPGCDRPQRSNGLCNTHRQQMQRGKPLKPIVIRVKNNSPCKFPGCHRTQASLGYCLAHWSQQHKGRQLKPLRPRIINPPEFCQNEGCRRKHYAHGLCKYHYEFKKNKWGTVADYRLSREAKRKAKIGTIRDLKYADRREPFIYLPNHPRSLSNGWVRVAILAFEKLEGRTTSNKDHISMINGIPVNRNMRKRVHRCPQCQTIFVEMAGRKRVCCSRTCASKFQRKFFSVGSHFVRKDSINECDVEAVANRRRISKPRRGKKRLQNGNRRASTMEEQRVPQGGMQRHSRRHVQQASKVQRKVCA